MGCGRGWGGEQLGVFPSPIDCIMNWFVGQVCAYVRVVSLLRHWYEAMIIETMRGRRHDLKHRTFNLGRLSVSPAY